VHIGQAVLIWTTQTILVVCSLYAGLALREGVASVEGLPALVRYAAEHDHEADAGRYLFPPLTVPVEAVIQWETTGNTWLDAKASKEVFTVSAPVSTDAAANELTIELKTAQKTVYYNRITQYPFVFSADIEPNVPYRLVVTGMPRSQLEITLNGLLKPTKMVSIHSLREG